MTLLASPRRRILVSSVLVMLAIAVVFANVARPALASGSATLTIFVGNVSVKSANTAATAAAQTGAQLHQGDEVTTGPNTKAAINFPGGSVTRLDSNTQLTISTLQQGVPSSAWQIGLTQTLGKTWHKVGQLVGGSSYTVNAPNGSQAEVRGTQFQIIVEQDPVTHSPVVRINNYEGAIDVTANHTTVSVPVGQSTTIVQNNPPAPPAPISQQDRQDSFTTFNLTVNTSTGPPTAVNTGSLNQGASSGVQAGSPADGNTDLDFALGWPGSCFRLKVYDPDGNLYQQTDGCTPPIHVVVPKGRAGTWSFEAIDEQSAGAEAWWVIISKTNPSTLPPTPFFTGSCGSHSVTAGASDSWTVTARSAAGRPAFSATGLPAFGTLNDHGDGTATLSWSPPVETPGGDRNFTVSASIAGASATLSCTEHVVAHDSTISGRVTFPGGGATPVTVRLSPGALSTTTASDGSYFFTALLGGTYHVAVTVPTGYAALGAASADILVTGDDSASGVNFALARNLTVTTTSLPGAQEGVAYHEAVAASGGVPPNHWTLTSGALPNGLSLADNGTVSGTPAQGTAGSYTLGVHVADSRGGSASGSVSLTVGQLAVNPAQMPAMLLGQLISQQLTVTGGTAPYTYALSAGHLPGGLSLSGDTISGTPTTAGAYSFTIRATDSQGATGAQAYSGTIGEVVTVGPASLPEAEAGVAYSQPMSAGGGTAPYAWTASGLPAGLAIDPATGVVSGTPTTAGTFSAHVTATDAYGVAGSASVGIPVAGPPAVAMTGLVSGTAGFAYTQALTASGGIAPYTWAATGLPAGLSVSGSSITGTPSAAGSSTVTLTVTDINGVASPPAAFNLYIASRSVNTGDCQTTAPATAPATGPAVQGSGSPSVTGVSPNRGPSCGQTPVTITGSGFTNASAVTFGTAQLTQPHTGSYSAQLQWGSFVLDDGGDSWMYQTVTVPTGTSTLSFWYRDFCTDGPSFDYLAVQVQDVNGAVLGNVPGFSPRTQCDHAETWTHATFDLSPFANRTVRLYFDAHGDDYGGPDTSPYFIDDVTIVESPGLVVNGGFETGDMTGWTIGTLPNSYGGRGMLPRVTWGFVIDSDSQIRAVAPPQPAETTHVQVLTRSAWESNIQTAANAFTYGTNLPFDHYALRIMPNHPIPAASTSDSLNGALGPLQPGQTAAGAVVLFGVDASGNDVGPKTLPAGETVTFSGLAPAPTAYGGCASGPTIGGSAMGSPIAVTAVPASFSVMGCGSGTFNVNAATASGKTVANAVPGGANDVQVRIVPGSPSGSFTITPSAPSVTAGTQFSATISGLHDAYGNPAGGAVAGVETNFPTPQVAGCPTTATPSVSGNLANGGGTVLVTLVQAGTGLYLSIGGASSSATALTIHPTAANRLWIAGLTSAGNRFTAGTSIGVDGSFAIDAVDPYCNEDTTWSGRVTVSSSDPKYSATTTPASGHTFTTPTFRGRYVQTPSQQYLFTAGTQSLSLTSGTLAGPFTQQVTIAGAAPTGPFTLSAPSSTSSGSFTVSATSVIDAYGNPANGTLTLTPTGSGSAPVAGCTAAQTTSVPGSFAVNSGSGSAYPTIVQPGGYRLTASDGTNETVSVTIVPGGVAKFVFPNLATTYTGGPAQVVRSGGTSFEVDAVDSNCNVATSDNGTVTVSSTDPRYSTTTTPNATNQQGMTRSLQLTNGVYTEPASANYLFTNGSWTLSATDGSHTGTSPALAVSGSNYNATIAPCSISGSVTWNAAGSPYLVSCNVNVYGSLTIDGTGGTVDVQVLGNYGFYFPSYTSSLTAIGTGTAPITFFNPASAAAGVWNGINGYDYGPCCTSSGSYKVLNLQYATIKGANRGVYWSNYAWDAAATRTTGVTLNNVTITNSAVNALNLQNTNAVITNSAFIHTAGSTPAVFLNTPAATYPNLSFSGNTVTNNAGYGIDVNNNAQTITCTLVTGNHGGMIDEGFSHSGTRLTSSNIYANNGTASGPYDLVGQAGSAITSTGNYWGSGGYASAFTFNVSDSGDAAAPTSCASATPLAVTARPAAARPAASSSASPAPVRSAVPSPTPSGTPSPTSSIGTASAPRKA